MQSKAKSVDEYLAELPEDRRPAIEAVRQVILDNLGKGFEEGMQYGMIGYYVPHSIYPAGYHCDPKQPLPYICLASQKNYMSLYMMSVYGDGEGLKQFIKEWKETGKKLDMGKSCLRFKKLDDLAIDVIARAIRRVSVNDHVEFYESVLKESRKKPSGAKKKASKKLPAKGKMARKSAKKK